MIRRAVHAGAALFAVLLLIVGPGVPAHADPQPISQLCTVKEWQNPAHFADCAKRLSSATAQRAQCIQAPTPSSPDAGVAGWLTTRPDADLRSGVVGMYTRYGVGGYRLDLYDVTCAGAVTHPEASFQNSIASMEFALAAAIVGGANGLREHAYDPGSMWGWTDDSIDSLTKQIHEHVFSVFGILAIAGAGFVLLWRAPTGRLSSAVRIAGWALLVTVVTTAVAKWPLPVAHGFDKAGTTSLSAIHSVLGPGPADVPADRCAFAATDPAACKDHRTVAVRASDSVTEAILYKSWLRAELGSSDSVTAQKYGPALYDATTFTWAESANMREHPELRPQIVDEKARLFLAVAEQIKAEDPEAYANLQGLRGTDRVGSGLVAVLSAIAFAGFDTIASLAILLGFLVVRVVVVLWPLVATWGVLEPASSQLRRLVDAVVTALFNIVRYGALAGLYLWATVHVFDSDLPGAAQIVAVLLAGVACWLALRPLRKLKGSVFRREAADPEDADRSDRWRQALSVVARAARSTHADHDPGPIRAEATVGRPRRPETRALPSGGRR